MELIKVDVKQRDKIIENVLIHSFSAEERKEIIINLNINFDDGSDLIAIKKEDILVGYFIISPYSESSKVLDELVMEEFFFVDAKLNDEVKNELALQIKELKKVYKPNKLEIIITKEIQWLGNTLSDKGFICELIKLEKVLPNKKNLPDVIDLIKDSIPKEQVYEGMIMQVLLQLNDEYDTELIDTDEDLENIMKGDWEPIMVVLSVEPIEQNINELITASNQLLNWDDYELTYSY